MYSLIFSIFIANPNFKEFKSVKERFQDSYLRNGVKDFGSQRPYLEELAALYENKFTAENKWPDALKVCVVISINAEN